MQKFLINKISAHYKIQEPLSVDYIKDCPHSKPEGFSQKYKEHGFKERELVESQAYCKNIPYKRQPAQHCQVRAIFVYSGFLLLQLFPGNMEPFLYPFPLAQITDIIRCKAAQTVAQRCHTEGSQRIASGQQCSYQQNLSAERNNRCRQKTPYKKPHKAQPQQTFHPIVLFANPPFYNLPLPGNYLLALKKSVIILPHSSARIPPTTSVLGCIRDGVNMEYPLLESFAP